MKSWFSMPLCRLALLEDMGWPKTVGKFTIMLASDLKSQDIGRRFPTMLLRNVI